MYIEKILKENPGKWYCAKDIAGLVGMYQCNARQMLDKLKSMDENIKAKSQLSVIDVTPRKGKKYQKCLYVMYYSYNTEESENDI